MNVCRPDDALDARTTLNLIHMIEACSNKSRLADMLTRALRPAGITRLIYVRQETGKPQPRLAYEVVIPGVCQQGQNSALIAWAESVFMQAPDQRQSIKIIALGETQIHQSYMVVDIGSARIKSPRRTNITLEIIVCAAADALQRFAAINPKGNDFLSMREQAVLCKIASGANNAAVATQLSISTHTVDGYVRRIFHKLGVNRRSAAVAEALRLGIL